MTTTRLRTLYRSPEAVGVAAGLLMLMGWPLASLLVKLPVFVLLMLVGLAAAAGGTVASLAAFQSVSTELAVRRGAWAGAFAVSIAGACFTLMARTAPGWSSGIKGLGVAASSAMPAMLAGTIAAGLGALCFRRPAVGPVEYAEPGFTDMHLGFRWRAWGIVAAAIVLALFASVFPKFGSAELATSSARSFHYATPEALKSAAPIAWRVTAQRDFGRINPKQGFAFSKDQRLIASAADGTGLAIHDLESEAMNRISGLPFTPDSLAFSPTGDRMFIVGGDDPRRIGVVDIANGSSVVLPQPKKHAVPQGAVTWWTDEEVLFVSDPRTMWSLDLDSLELDRTDPPPAKWEQVLKEVSHKPPETKQWEFGRGSMPISAELPQTEGSKQWSWQTVGRAVLADRQQASVRFFREIELIDGDLLMGVSDGSKLLRFRDGTLRVFYFDTRPVPPLRWRITLPHAPLGMPDHVKVTQALEQGDLALFLYSPMVNPLTGKTVGPERSRPKAVLHFSSWLGTEAHVWVVADFLSFSPGDVLADVHISAEPPELLPFDQPHRWWIVAPDPLPDAEDPAKLPLVATLEKQRAAAVAGQASGAKASEEVRREARPTWASLFSPTNPGPASPTAAPRASTTELEKEVSAFVIEHHRKASNTLIGELAKDYADLVDYLNHGVVDRTFIHRDGLEYHQRFRAVHEEVTSPVRVEESDGGLFLATYRMTNRWQKASDGQSGSGTFVITLHLQPQPGGLKIIRQRAEKQE